MERRVSVLTVWNWIWERKNIRRILVVGDVIRFKAPTSGSRAVEIMEIVRKGEFKDPEIKRLGTSAEVGTGGSATILNTTLAPFGADLEMDVFAMEVDGPRPYLVTNVYQGQELPLRRRGFAVVNKTGVMADVSVSLLES